MAAFTTNVIGVVNDETVDGNQKVDERGTTNNTHIINHGQQNVDWPPESPDNQYHLNKW